MRNPNRCLTREILNQNAYKTEQQDTSDNKADQIPHYIFSKDPSYSDWRPAVRAGLGTVIYRVPNKSLAQLLIDMYYEKNPKRPFDLKAVPTTDFQLRDYIEIDTQLDLVERIFLNIGCDDYQTSDPELLAVGICRGRLEDIELDINRGYAVMEKETSEANLASEHKKISCEPRDHLKELRELADRARKVVLAFRLSHKKEFDPQGTTDIHTLILSLRELGQDDKARTLTIMFTLFSFAVSYRFHGEAIYDNESAEEEHDRLQKAEPEPDFDKAQSSLGTMLYSVGVLLGRIALIDGGTQVTPNLPPAVQQQLSPGKVAVTDSDVIPATESPKTKQEIPPENALLPLDAEHWWTCPNLTKLRNIDSNPKRNGIAGTKKDRDRLRAYLRKHTRPDIAETLYWEKDRIKTTMPYGRMFLQH